MPLPELETAEHGNIKTRAAHLIPVLNALEAEKQRPLRIVEVGSIRGDHWRADGWSTLYIAEFIRSSKYDHVFTTIDRKTEVVRRVLERNGVSTLVDVVEGQAQEVLQSLTGPVDFFYLDGASDANQQLREFRRAKKIAADDAVFMTDDFDTKPTRILPVLALDEIPFISRGRMFGFRLGTGSTDPDAIGRGLEVFMGLWSPIVSGTVEDTSPAGTDPED